MWTYDFTSNNYHHEYQWLSFSEDGGYTFITPSNEGDDNLYNGKHINPVVIAYKDNTTEFIPENEQTEFRDPSISKYLGTAKDSDGNDKEDRKFIMTIARSQEYKVSFYESNDGIEYKESSKYELGGYLGHQYECPNFGHLKNKEQRDGEESSYWVLFVLINPGSITGGSANWYVIGTFGRENGYLTDKLVFTQTHKYLNIFDYGKDFYALQIYFVNPDSDEELKEGYDTLTLIPWTTNWQYSQTTPTDPWRGGMGIPREFYLSHISLNSQVSFLTLKQRPILNHKNFENSINTAVTPIKISSLSLSSENREIDYSKGAFGAFEFLLEFNITGEGTETPEFNVLFKGGSLPEEYLEIGYNNDGPIVYINRGHSNVQFVKKNAMFNHNTAIYIQEKKTNYNIYGLIDRNILEVFFNIDDYEKKTSFIASTQTFFFTGGNFVSSVEFVPVTEGRFDIQFYGRQLGEFDFTEGAS
jgi:beta-fructofuranosidase